MNKINRILLIEPEPPGFHVFSRFKMPRLGLPLLGAIMKQRGYDVRIHVGDFAKKDFRRYADCNLVGLSTTTSTAPEAYRIAAGFRALGKPVVIGGVHATFMPEEALEYADFVVRGEAEDSFPALVERLERGEEPDDVPGISRRRQGLIVHHPTEPLIQDLDRLPFPDFSLLTSTLRLHDIPIQTSRGCPFPCNFCSVTKMFGRKVRFRSVESVIAELKQIPKPEVFFYDDNFCAKPEHTRSLLQRMIEEKIRLTYFSAQVRADVTRHPDLMELLHRTGCQQVYVGFESINPESLKEYNKRQTVEEIGRSMEVFRRYKMHVHGMFVIGSDHDQAYTAKETLRFAKKHGIDTVQFMMLTPLPGTELYKELDEQGRILSREWSLYDAHHCVYLPKQMSPLKLQKTTLAAMTRFYSWLAGLKGIARRDFYRVSRSFMGWYIIRRWKWENRGWNRRLRALSVQAYRTKLQTRLNEAQRQLEEAHNRIKDRLAHLPARLEEWRAQADAHLNEISRLAEEVVGAVEKDFARFEKRIEVLTNQVGQTISEWQVILAT